MAQHIDQNQLYDTFEDTRLRVENNVQTMQAATHGYVITQQSSFLDNYGAAASHVPTDLAQLQEPAAFRWCA